MKWCDASFYIRMTNEVQTDAYMCIEWTLSLKYFCYFNRILNILCVHPINRIKSAFSFIGHLRKCILLHRTQTNPLFHFVHTFLRCENFYYWIWFSSWVYARLHTTYVREKIKCAKRFHMRNFRWCSRCCIVFFVVGCGVDVGAAAAVVSTNKIII